MGKPNVEELIVGAQVWHHAWWTKARAMFAYDADNKAPEGWQWFITPLDPVDEESDLEPVVINHEKLMAAIKAIAEGKHEVNEECVTNCHRVMIGDAVNADFDATSADDVLQVAVYGRVEFG